MNFAFLIRTSIIWSPGFSRIRRSQQYAAIPAGIQPAEAGTPGWHIRVICSKCIRRHYGRFRVAIVGVRGITTTASGTDLTIALPQGTAANQVLKWDGTNWTPQAESTGGGSLSTFNAVGDRGIEVSEDGANWNNGPVTIEDGETLSVRPSEEVPFMKNFYVTEEHSNIESGDESPQGWPSSLGTTRWCRQVDENGQYPPGMNWSNAPARGRVWTWGGHQKGITIEGGADAQKPAWMITCFRTVGGYEPEEDGRFKHTP
jgi:hypothetical protein